jgi:putative transposase
VRGGKKHPRHRIYPYLPGKLAIARPNQVWCSDITYIPVKRGLLYLVAIMDWATRKVLSWRLSNTLDASLCVEALEGAIAKYGKPERMNTDQGSQCTGRGIAFGTDTSR